MKIIKYTGLTLFIIGFLIFNISFFWASYQLNQQILETNIVDVRKRDLFLQQASEILNKEISSNFQFVQSISSVFERINEQQLNTYGITNQEIEKLHQLAATTFSAEIIAQVFSGDDEVNQFKRKAFTDYGSWLFGQSVSKEQLQSVSNNISKYGIINQFGFDRYQVKELTYSLTRAAAKSPVKDNPSLYILWWYGFCILGALAYILPRWKTEHGGIKNNNIFFNAMKNGGWLGMLSGSWLIAFYIFLYFYPEYMTNWIIMVDPISKMLNGG
ncbi:MAG TPA: 4Fe-4S ferredoxin, partial [Cyclobacteriaceae bacterium]|nr:4Fe-4S ferredoxin [Cyclobacteriaceae bacterium]